jgi:aldehyde dehydrogenase (NAD+)
MERDMGSTRLDHFINGTFVAPEGGDYIDVENPATGEIIARVASGTAKDVDLAVAAARAAFEDPSWRAMTPRERSSLLCRMIEIVKLNAEELVYLECISTGGTISRVSTLDLLSVLDIATGLAEAVKTYPFVTDVALKQIPEATHIQIRKEPIGICALITAWNFPLVQFLGKAMTAIAAGNTVVVKPTELAPNTSLRLAELFAPILPKGVLNVVNGTGAAVGDAMSAHPGIDKISFTGSTAVGQRILGRASQTVKRVTLELGGKGPAIVTPDAPLDLTAYGSLWGFLLNAGQACESGTRLIVHEDIKDAVLARMVTIASGLKLGNPLAPDTSISAASSRRSAYRRISPVMPSPRPKSKPSCAAS